MNRNFHKNFDKGTKTKLELFDAYFNESLPVFVHQKYWSDIFICDLFAGKGLNDDGEYGTAINILKGVSQHCQSIVSNQKNLYIILNDKKEYKELEKNTNAFIEKCKTECKNNHCIFVDTDPKKLIIKREDFKSYFNDKIYPGLVQKKDAMKLIFLDPFNFIMDNDLFEKLISLPKTDFMCFIPATFLRRFPTEPTFKKFIEDYGLSFSDTRFKESHRIIAQYIKNLVPKDKDYYIGHFSIEKTQKTGTGKNYYGVIFGSNSTLGAEKFQRVCWKLDPTVGEADYNIDNEPTYGGETDLFNTKPLKIENFEKELINKILNRELKTDIDVYKYALSSCFQPKSATNILKSMMQQKQIREFTTHNSDIHKIKNSNNIVIL